MPTFRYRIIEYHPERPSMIRSIRSHLTVDLDSAGDFDEWAAETWPSPRYAASLELGQPERPMYLGAGAA